MYLELFYSQGQSQCRATFPVFVSNYRNFSITPGDLRLRKYLDSGSRFKPGTSFAGMTNENRSLHCDVIPAEAGIQ